MSIKAIETTYNGYRFRSRAEARWAVFFDTAGIKYEYEKEGFELPSGRYLPDFWLPMNKVWFEVKGGYPSGTELNLAFELATNSGSPVWLAHGPVTLEAHSVIVIDGGYCDDLGDPCCYGQRFMDDRRHDGSVWLASEMACRTVSGDKFSDRWPEPYTGGFVNTCFNAAKSARFEFGERGQHTGSAYQNPTEDTLGMIDAQAIIDRYLARARENRERL